VVWALQCAAAMIGEINWPEFKSPFQNRPTNPRRQMNEHAMAVRS
jgi:hypothetical protein